MKNINWKVRVKNKSFWLAMIPALLIIVQLVAGWFGFEVPAEVISAEATKLINGVFMVLMLVGVINDPTIENFADSPKALTYSKPKQNAKGRKHNG